MKVIDIYNKVAKGEEVPHFIIDETEYYIGADGFVKDVFGEEVEWTIDKQWLNEEVEIIEEPKDKWNKLKIWLKEDAFKNLESKGIVLTTDEVLNQMAGLDDEEEPDLFEMIEDMKNKPKHIEKLSAYHLQDKIKLVDKKRDKEYDGSLADGLLAIKINELTKAVNYLLDKK